MPISAAEVTDQRLPALILQLGAVVQAAVEVAVTEGVLSIARLMPQSSWDRIGRYAQFAAVDSPGCWLGVYLDLWRRHGASPLWLLFPDTEFGRAGEVHRRLDPWVARAGVFTTWQGGFYCVPLDVAAGEEKDLVVRGVADRLKELAEELSALTPTQEDADGDQ